MKLSEFLKEYDANESDIINYSGQEAINAVQEDGNALRYVKVQTAELCKLAVQENGNALRYVKVQTEELCRLAMQQNGAALQYVDKFVFDVNRSVRERFEDLFGDEDGDEDKDDFYSKTNSEKIDSMYEMLKDLLIK